ncbi:MAG: bifunctional 4-hydroxy-3-methylbut-2-enyl diphosphate reductase/30S ribosomal protein S1 [Syntrophomonadaceae bacterium]
MRVILARQAGFCAGVKRAIDIAEECCDQEHTFYSLGPLVNNDEVVRHLESRGIIPIDSLEQVNPPHRLIIRSHGASRDLLLEAQSKGIEIIDATCPLVKQVHELVASLRGEGYDIVIFGDINHPEVKGILGWCDNKALVIKDVEQVSQIKPGQKIGIVSQTTKDESKFYELVEAIKLKTGEVKVCNTICAATKKRQQAARELAQEVELILVIGDRKSSNTTTLLRECQNTGVKSHQVQNADEIEPDWFKGVSTVGITAGASTPDWIIKEVMDRMTTSEENNNQEINEEIQTNEESFAHMEAEMADFTTPSRGDIINGKVIEVRDDEVMVDVGGKSEGIIPRRELSVQEVESARDLVAVGDEIEVMVLKWDDDGTILLSKKKVDSQKVMDNLEKTFESAETVEGIVTGSVKGGLLVDVGVVAFLPASHVEDGYVKNLDDYIGNSYKFKIIEFNRNKRRGSQVVLSRKELVAGEKAKLKEAFWQNIEEGQTRKGKVKRIVDYGVFIDLGGYEGLLHVSELDHHRIDHPSNVVSEGEEIDVFILALDKEKERVSLSRKQLIKSPWQIVLEKYNEGDIIEGKVVRLAPFGAFVEIEPGVDGLVHISHLANYRVEKPEDIVQPGQTINVKILSIDPEQKRIGLSIREVTADTERSEVEEYLDNQE